jgi:hypothetical protein
LDRVDKNRIGDDIRGVAKKHGGMPKVLVGIPDKDADREIRESKDFVYIDHSYFKRGWHTGNFRAVRNSVHLTSIVKRPTDRLKRFGVQIEPWRKKGREIVIVPLSERQQEFYNANDWLIQTESKLCQITDRPVVVKNRKTTTMRDFCRDTWAVVTHSSVAGVEATLMGIPVFSTERCPSWPVNAGPLERIETPEYSDARLELAASLSYASWNIGEVWKVKWQDYEYAYRLDGA